MHHAYEEANIQAVPAFIIGDSVLPGLYSQKTLEEVITEELKNSGDIFAEGMVCGIDVCD